VAELSKTIVSIGRGQANDILLEDPSCRISRLHAHIDLSTGVAMLSDLQSANGTYLNDRRVSAPTELHADDVLRIEPFRLVYRDGSVSAAPEPDSLPAFHIESAAVELNQLQERVRLVDPAAGDAVIGSSAELRALELLHEVVVRLARTNTTAEVVETSVDLLFKIEGVQRATLLMWDEEQQGFSDVRLYRSPGQTFDTTNAPSEYDPRNLVLSKTILNKVRSENRPLVIHDARSRAELSDALSIMRAGIQAAFCAPLTVQGRFLGILYADNLATPAAFSSSDFQTFSTISAQAGLAVASALTRELLIKQQVEQAAMRLYLPPQVADLIATTRGSLQLGGILQPVTVLFADIRGFTRLSENLDAGELVVLLNEFFTAMTNVVFDHGGTLDKYIGDCVMALFGAPVPMDDHASRAILTATDMQREVARLNEVRRANGLVEIEIGVGVHTGLAVIGNIGSEQRMQYTAIGDTVNVASRVADKAPPGHVVVSEDVRAAVSDHDSFVSLGQVELKGRQQRLTLYSVPWQKGSAI
jgi:adenylate cyclase